MYSLNHTFNNPTCGCSPSTANSNKVDWEGLSVLIRQKCGSFSLLSNGNHVLGPLDPESSELAGAQKIATLKLSYIWLAAVFSDHRLCVFPATDENFNHWI